LGIRWCSHRCGYYGQFIAGFLVPLRPIRGWEAVLEWIFVEGFPQLG
jgi:hypothetical protein